MKRQYLIFFSIALVLFIGVFIVLAMAPSHTNQPQETPSSSLTITTQPVKQNSPPAPQNKRYTLQEISTHNNQSDCWLVINNTVYNVTSFIPTHPGGMRILEGCGKDATNLFTNVEHSSDAKTLLNQYRIGSL